MLSITLACSLLRVCGCLSLFTCIRVCVCVCVWIVRMVIVCLFCSMHFVISSTRHTLFKFQKQISFRADTICSKYFSVKCQFCDRDLSVISRQNWLFSQWIMLRICMEDLYIYLWQGDNSDGSDSSIARTVFKLLNCLFRLIYFFTYSSGAG